jgi:hypothetical protein
MLRTSPTDWVSMTINILAPLNILDLPFTKSYIYPLNDFATLISLYDSDNRIQLVRPIKDA